MESGVNTVEVIELDCDEPEETNGNSIPINDGLHCFSQNRTSNLIQYVNKNIDSSIVNNIPHKMILKGNTKKTIALIPVDYLKYCQKKDGEYVVKLDTLNKLKQQNVHFINVPKQGNINKNYIQETRNIADTSTIQHSNILKTVNKKKSDITNVESTLQKSIPKLLVTQKLDKMSQQKSLLIRPKVVNTLQLFSEQHPSSIVSDTKKKLLVRTLKPVEGCNTSNIIYTPNYGLVSLKNKVPIVHSTPHSFITIKQAELQELSSKPTMDLSTNIGLDPLEIPTVFNNLNHINSPPPLLPFIHTDKINNSQQQLNEKSLEMADTNSDTESADESFNHTLICNDSSDLTDPLGDLPNIFEPIITLDEPKEKLHSLEKSLTEGLRGGGIPDNKIEELENMLRTNTINEPFKVMIPSKFIKYCVRKNGKFLVDLDTLKKINEEKQRPTTVNNDTIIVSDDEKPNERKPKRLCTTRKRTSQNVNKTKIQSPININLMPSLKRESSIITSDKCRYQYIKSSAWEKIDPTNNTCKGFNEREENISKTCFKNFSEYLAIAKEDCSKLLCEVVNKNGQSEPNNVYRFLEPPTNNDLYFTKKIEILDEIGRRVRTEHITPNKRQAKYGTQNTRKKIRCNTDYVMPKTKPCHVIIQRNELVEKLLKTKLEHDKIKKKLDSKFVKTAIGLKKNPNQPMIIVNKNNFHNIKLDERFCANNNVIFVKNILDNYPENVYKSRSFKNMVEKGRITITSPSTLQGYFALGEIIDHF